MRETTQTTLFQKQARNLDQNKTQPQPLSEGELKQVAGGKMGPSNYE